MGVTAYRRIYRKIMTLDYQPGMRLEEKHLMDELGIGRTPIREALQRLEDDYMVESHHNKGFIVRPITIQNTKAAFAALEIMELGVAHLAVRQEISQLLELMANANNTVRGTIQKKDLIGLVEANAEFHKCYAQCSGNDYLIHGLHKVRCETNRLAYLSFGNEIDPMRTTHEHYASVIEQHEDIIKLLKKRDEDALKHTLTDHISTFKNRILLYMSS